MLRRDEGESIAIPAKKDGAARDFIRRRGDLKESLKSMKQRLLKFLLRKGKNCGSGRYWTGKHYKRLSGLRFENGLEQLTFEEYADGIHRWKTKPAGWTNG